MQLQEINDFQKNGIHFVQLAALEFFKIDVAYFFRGGQLPSESKWLQGRKNYFELFSGALQENPVRAPGAITGGAVTGQGPIQETIFGELFSGALQENPVIAPGQLHEKMFAELFW